MPVQALRTRKKGEEDGRGPAEGRRREREDERRRDSRKPAASDRVWGRGAAGEASAGLKVEGAKDVQRVESLAERNNRLAGKETKKALQNCIDQLVLKARVRKRGGSGQPPEQVAARRLAKTLLRAHVSRSATRRGARLDLSSSLPEPPAR